jgi:hypothetical protein
MDMPDTGDPAANPIAPEETGGETEPVRLKATEPASEACGFITFHLSGVTQNNPDGESR